MISGDGWGVSFAGIGLTVEEQTQPGTLADLGSNPDPLGERQRCYPSTTAVVTKHSIFGNPIGVQLRHADFPTPRCDNCIHILTDERCS